MKLLSFSYETSLQFSEPVSDHSFILRCLPKNTPRQQVLESHLFTQPRIALNKQVDGFGNLLRVGYCPQKHTEFDFFASGLVCVDRESPEATRPEPAHPVYLQPSPLANADEALATWARGIAGVTRKEAITPITSAVDEETAAARWQIIQDLSTAAHARLAYTPGATTTSTTAVQALELGAGVCQDYTHVLISALRACGIPARYCNGLMSGEGATHAWVVAHDGIRWHGIDPTNDKIVDDNYLLFSEGRDFGDCAIEQGVFRGTATQTQVVTACVGENMDGTSPFEKM